MKKTKLTGDNYPHTKMMSLEEWANFAGNFKTKAQLKRYLKINQFNSFSSFIEGAFVWKSSSQGHRYWSEISERQPCYSYVLSK